MGCVGQYLTPIYTQTVSKSHNVYYVINEIAHGKLAQS
nr:MAG TPA: hypothetical protein [Inoviridae sp.]